MPKYIVSAPDGRRFKVTLPEGQTDAIGAVQRSLGITPPETPAPSPSITDLINTFPVQRTGLGALKSGLSRNLSELGILGGDLLPALGASALGADEYARQQLLEAEQTRAAEEEVNPRQFQGFQGLSLNTLPAFLGEKLGESAADIAAIASGAGVAGSLAKRAAMKQATETITKNMLGRQAEKVAANRALALPMQVKKPEIIRKAAAERVKKSLIGTGAADVAAAAAGFGTGTGLAAPRLFEGIYQETGQLEPAAAVVGGALQGALDSVLPLSLRQIFRTSSPAFKAAVIKKLGERKKLPSFIADYAGRMATGTLKGAAIEGLTEGAQESIAISAEKFVQAGEQFWGSEDFNRVFEAAATGAIVGSPFGTVSGIADKARERGIQADELRRREPPKLATPPNEPPGLPPTADTPIAGAPPNEPPGLPPTAGAPTAGTPIADTPIADTPIAGTPSEDTSLPSAPVGLNEEVAPEVITGMTEADKAELNQFETEPTRLMPVPEVFKINKTVPDLLTAIEEDKNAYSAIARLSDKQTALDQLAGDIYNLASNLGAKERLPYSEESERDSFVSTLSDKDKDYVENKVVSLRDAEEARETETETEVKKEDRRTGVVASKPYQRPEVESTKLLSDEIEKTKNAYTALENIADRTTAINQFVADTYKGVSKTPNRPDSLPFSDVPQRQAFAKTLSPEEKKQVNVGRQKLVKAAAEKTQPAPITKVDDALPSNIKKKREIEEMLSGVDPYSSGSLFGDLEMRSAPEVPTEPAMTTPTEFRKVVRKFLGREPSDQGVLKVTKEPPAKSTLNAQTMAISNKTRGSATVFTGRIPKGKEISVFMHEVGAHLGMEQLIGKTNYQYLIGKIKEWAADTTADKLENKIALAAAKRIPAGTSEDAKNDEVIAYFVSEAIENFGVNPKALSKVNSPLGLFFRYVMQGVKDILTRLGMPNYQPTAQDIIDITYGAAQLVYKRADDRASAAEISKQEPEVVLAMEGTNPATLDTSSPKMSEQIVNFIDSVTKEANPALRPAAVTVVNKMTRLGSVAKRLYVDALSVFQLSQIAGDINKDLGKTIRNIVDLTSRRDAAIANRKQDIENFILASRETLSKYSPAVVDKLYEFMHESSRLQVKFDADEAKNAEQQVLYNQFNVFKRQYPELAKMYFDLRDQYRKLYTEWKGLIESPEILGPASKTLHDIVKNTLDPYFPLYRRGDFWVRYVDKDGIEGVQAFEEALDRRNFIRELKEEGGKVEKTYYKPTNQQIQELIPKEQLEKIIKLLRENKASNDIMEGVYSVYLDMFSNQSVMQMYRKRKGLLGYRKDAIANFADVGTRMAINIEQFKSVREIDKQIQLGIAQAKSDPNSGISDAIATSLDARAKTLKNPVQSSLFDVVAGNLGHNAYRWFILGNMSSALINVLQIPGVVVPLLSGRYGWGNTLSALNNALAMYWKGGRDNNTNMVLPNKWRLSDLSFGGDKSNLTPEFQRLYQSAINRGAIRRSTGQDLMEIRNLGVSDPNKKFSYNFRRAETGLSFLFQNGERMNREITLLAAYNLARKKGKSEAEATQEALDLVDLAHGSAMSELGPLLLQNPIGKIVGTFKRFALAQTYLQYKLFKDAFLNKNIDPELRREARNQLIGLNLTTFAIAGLKGTPVWGVANILASMIGADDDEPFDLEEYILRNFGNAALRGPLGAALNVDIGSRAGFSDMFWRTDEKRLAEVGLVTYVAEQAAGPSFAMVKNTYEGIITAFDGNLERGIEQALPSALKNLFKGLRYGIEGATTKNGIKIIDDPNIYNVVMSIAGFAPNDLSDAYARNNIMGNAQRKALEKRASLLDIFWAATKEGDVEALAEVQEDIDSFNKTELGSLVPIDSDTIKKSRKSRERAEEEAVQGMQLSPKLRAALMERAGVSER